MNKNNLFQLELENEAARFRKQHGFGDAEPVHLESFLIKNNVLTLYRPLSRTMAGMAIKSGDCDRFMMINSNHSVGKQNFTIAHELYHLFLQENFNSKRCITGLFDKQKDLDEKKADYFAANLLLPRLGVYELIPQSEKSSIGKVSKETTFKIQQYYGVSIKAVIFRLIDLGFADKNYYDVYQDMGKLQTARLLGYDAGLYQKGNENKVVSDYGTMASKLFQSRKISESYYFELLNSINIDPFEVFAGDEE